MLNKQAKKIQDKFRKRWQKLDKLKLSKDITIAHAASIQILEQLAIEQKEMKAAGYHYDFNNEKWVKTKTS